MLIVKVTDLFTIIEQVRFFADNSRFLRYFLNLSNSFYNGDVNAISRY